MTGTIHNPYERTPEEIKEAKRVADEFHTQLSRAKFEQETQRDKTLVLIAGGALTVSFAFVSTLVEKAHIVRLGWLVGAWMAWCSVLAFTVMGYTFSIKIYRVVLQALSEGDYARARNPPLGARLIEPLNVLSGILAIAGFSLFSIFVIGNLKQVSADQAQLICGTKPGAENGQSKEVRQEKSGAEVQRGDKRQLPPVPAPGVPPPGVRP